MPSRQLRFAKIQEIRKRRMRVLRLILSLLLFALGISVIIFLLSMITIKHVSCKLDSESCEKELQTIADKLLGKNILSNLRLSHPYLLVQTQRVWPNAARVLFKKPEVLLSFQSSNFANPPYSLTSSGFLVSYLGENKYPPIIDLTLEGRPLGEKAPEKSLRFYKELLTALQKYRDLSIQSLKVVSEDEIEIVLAGNIRAQASQDRIDDELSSLQAILLSPTMDTEGKVIDLRFQNPVLKTNTFNPAPLGVE